MTKKQAELTLIAIKKNFSGDPEIAHLEADKVLLELLKSLGCIEVCNAFNDIDKWYA